MPSGGSVSWNLRQEKIPTRDEVVRTLAIARKASRRDWLVLEVCQNTALRICEVLHIRREGLRGERLTITRRKKKVLSEEFIWIPPDVVAELEAWSKALPPRERWMFPGGAEPCVLVRSGRKKAAPERLCDGGHLSKREIQRRWTRYLKRAKAWMKGRGIHSLRHYAITAHYQANRDVFAAQMFAGHSSPSVTQRYAHVLDSREQIMKMKKVL